MEKYFEKKVKEIHFFTKFLKNSVAYSPPPPKIVQFRFLLLIEGVVYSPSVLYFGHKNDTPRLISELEININFPGNFT